MHKLRRPMPPDKPAPKSSWIAPWPYWYRYKNEIYIAFGSRHFRRFPYSYRNKQMKDRPKPLINHAPMKKSIKVLKLCLSTFLSIFLIFNNIGSWNGGNCMLSTVKISTYAAQTRKRTKVIDANLVHPPIVCVKFQMVDSQQVPSWITSVQSRKVMISEKYLENAAILARLRSGFGCFQLLRNPKINTLHAPPSIASHSKFKLRLNSISIYEYELCHDQAAMFPRRNAPIYSTPILIFIECVGDL